MAKKSTKSKAKKSRRKRSKQKNNTIEVLRSIVSFFRDERIRFIISIFMLFFATYLTLAFVSYLFTWKVDQSELSKNLSEIPSSEINVENWAGTTGARLANLFIHKWFGIPSFAFIFLLVVVAARIIGLRLCGLRKSLKYTVIGVIWFSIALGFLFGKSYFYLGGAHGYFLSEWFNARIGIFGTTFLLIATAIAFVIFTFDKAMLWVKTTCKQKIAKKQPDFAFEGVEYTDDKSQNEKKEKKKGGFLRKNQRKQKSKDAKEKAGDEDENTTEKKEFVINEKGEKVDVSSLGFEIENRRDTVENDDGEEKKDEEKEETPETEENKEGSLTMRVEQNADILADDISDEPELRNYDPKLDLSNYKIPSLDLLEDHRAENSEVTEEELRNNKDKIVETLQNFKIEIRKIKAMIGPTITLYEIVPAPGIRISKIRNLEDDIALSLAALGIRIIAPMPGRGTIGIEVPNQKPEIVSMRSVISSRKFQNTKYELPIALGKTISNETFVFDLTKMPHLLVAGATGQGKSVGLNAIIASLLYKKHPAELKFVLVDPKKVELTLYEKIERHFLAQLPDAEEPIITDNQKVINTLSSLNIEMDNRYNLLKAAMVRNIKEYNQKFINRKLNPQKGHRYLPYIVLVIDEFADLIMTAGKEIELPLARIAQLARAVGIHLLVATQRPSTNIITGVIKANFPSRIAFKVASMMDSRTILDSPGANQLIGRGDMLITQGSELVRLQCAFIDTPEIDSITDYIGSQQGYPTAHLLPDYETGETEEPGAVDLNNRDALFDDAARVIVMNQQGSTSLIQRKLSIGYNRAGRIIDQLEAAGIVGPFEGSKARQVLYTDEYSLEKYLNTLSK